MNTSDKLKKNDEISSHRNGTVTGSEHKIYSNSKDGLTKVKGRKASESQPAESEKNMNDAKDRGDDNNQNDDEIETHKENKKPICNPKFIACLNKILENGVYITFMMIVTIYALFGDDFRLLLAPKSADEVFWSITVAAMFFFLVELGMASIAQKDYFLGFYFWLDLIATISLITDIGWIYNEITGGGDINANDASQASSLARAGRTARVGTRAGRIVRLVRLIRIVKLYKHATKALEKETDDDITQEELEQINQKNTEEDIPKESKVGQKLSDLTTRRVIVIVLIMMFSIPVLSLDTYRETPNFFQYSLQLISSYQSDQNGPGWNTARDLYINNAKDTRNPIVSLNANGDEYNSNDPPLDDLRIIEVLIATHSGDDYVSVHDNRKNVKIDSGLSIGRTLFICLVLTLAAM